MRNDFLRSLTCPRPSRFLKSGDPSNSRLFLSKSSTKELFEGGALLLVGTEIPSPRVLYLGQILDVKAKGKCLEVKPGYGGGCREHEFELDFTTCKVVRLGSKRVEECNAPLIHGQGSDDMCKAYLTRKHSIDLSHLSVPVLVKLAGKRALVK